MFDIDNFPSRPKILFIGNAISSHVQGWINLLKNSEINVRLFSVAEGYPDSDWETKVYLTTKYPPENLDENTRLSWFPVPEEWYKHESEVELAKIKEKSREELIALNLNWGNEVNQIDKKFIYEMIDFLINIFNWKEKNSRQFSDLNLIKNFEEFYENLDKGKVKSIQNLLIKFGFVLIKWNLDQDFFSIISQQKKIFLENYLDVKKTLEGFPLTPDFPIYPLRPPAYPQSQFPLSTPAPRTNTTSQWLAQIIEGWEPDIIHTFGIDSGSEFYYETRKKFKLEKYGKWIIKVFGGSDLAFNIYKSEKSELLQNMFCECDEIIFDNQFYTNLVIEKGLLQPLKVSKISPLPGSGGIDVNFIRKKWKHHPSKRKNIVWPKSYETKWSKAVPVLLALINIWKQIQPCDIYMLTVNEEISDWLLLLPTEMKQYVHIYEGVKRSEVIDFMLNSRVMIATSLIDGIPNVIYEAMACGTIPIVSPLESIKTIMNEENVLFADNLNQLEIENSILKLMKDDILVDKLAINNLDFVKKYADLPTIQKKVVDHYESICRLE